MRLHFARKTPCPVVEGGEDIDVKVLYEELGDIQSRKQNFECEFCNKFYSSVSSLSHHRKRCMVNSASKTTDLTTLIEKTVAKQIQKLQERLLSQSKSIAKQTEHMATAFGVKVDDKESFDSLRQKAKEMHLNQFDANMDLGCDLLLRYREIATRKGLLQSKGI